MLPVRLNKKPLKTRLEAPRGYASYSRNSDPISLSAVAATQPGVNVTGNRISMFLNHREMITRDRNGVVLERPGRFPAIVRPRAHWFTRANQQGRQTGFARTPLTRQAVVSTQRGQTGVVHTNSFTVEQRCRQFLQPRVHRVLMTRRVHINQDNTARRVTTIQQFGRQRVRHQRACRVTRNHERLIALRTNDSISLHSCNSRHARRQRFAFFVTRLRHRTNRCNAAQGTCQTGELMRTRDRSRTRAANNGHLTRTICHINQIQAKTIATIKMFAEIRQTCQQIQVATNTAAHTRLAVAVTQCRASFTCRRTGVQLARQLGFQIRRDRQWGRVIKHQGRRQRQAGRGSQTVTQFHRRQAIETHITQRTVRVQAIWTLVTQHGCALTADQGQQRAIAIRQRQIAQAATTATWFHGRTRRRRDRCAQGTHLRQVLKQRTRTCSGEQRKEALPGNRSNRQHRFVTV